MYCHKQEKARLLEGVEGDLVLKDSPLDPIADIPVRRVVDINWSERTTFQTGVIHSRVPAEWLLPFAHQRYDDLSVLGEVGLRMDDDRSLPDHLGGLPRGLPCEEYRPYLDAQVPRRVRRVRGRAARGP